MFIDNDFTNHFYRSVSMDREVMELRTKQLALRIIRLVASLPTGRIHDVLGRQLLRAGTSVGANYCEARRASSRRHFVTILEIATRECRETAYWLDLLAESELIKPSLIADLQTETRELIAILTATCKTAKQSAAATRKKKE